MSHRAWRSVKGENTRIKMGGKTLVMSSDVFVFCFYVSSCNATSIACCVALFGVLFTIQHTGEIYRHKRRVN